MTIADKLYVVYKSIKDNWRDLFLIDTPKNVTLQDVDDNGNLVDFVVQNLGTSKKKVDDWVAGAKSIESMPYGFYLNTDSLWKSKLTRIGKVNYSGCIDFLLYSKGDYNYSTNIAIRVTLSRHNVDRIEVRIKPLHENDVQFIHNLYTIHVDKDGYFWLGVSAEFTSHVLTQVINNKSAILTMDEVKTYEELNAIGGEILPITEITEQTYQKRIENYVV